MTVSKERRLVLAILGCLTIIASVCKILVGVDIDENYIVILGARLTQGDHLFRECWDLYQTTGLTMALLLWIFRSLTGGFTGVVLACRIVTAVLQLVLGAFVYCCLKSQYKNADLAGIFVANLLPRATLNLEYGFLSCNYILVAVCLIFVVTASGKKLRRGTEYALTVLAGLFYAMGILSYPTMVISLAVLFLFFWQKRKAAGKLFLTLFLTWLVSAGTFLGYVFLYISPDEMWQNIWNGVLRDESHEGANLLQSMLSSLLVRGEKLDQLFWMLGCAAVLSVILFAWRRIRFSLTYGVMLTSSVALIALNVFGLRPCGPYGLQIRYVIIVLLGMYEMYRWKNRDIPFLFYGMGIAMFLGTLMGSNLGSAENGAFLYLALVALILCQGEASCGKREKYILGYVAVVLFVGSIIFAKGFLVRIDGTSPANILEYRTRMEEGPLKGIYLYPSDGEKYNNRKAVIDTKCLQDDVVLFLSDDPIYNIFTETRFTSATALTTPVYGEQWVEYYGDRQYIQPTVIFVDSNYIDSIESFIQETSFGRFLSQERNFCVVDEAEGFWVLRICTRKEVVG